jgi:HSP20 family molecular chaperone IbpA
VGSGASIAERLRKTGKLILGGSFQNINHDCFNEINNLVKKEGSRMSEYRIKVAPNTVAYADADNHKLVVEFAIPGAPTETIDVKILEDSIHLTAPARDVEYVSALALGCR